MVFLFSLNTVFKIGTRLDEPLLSKTESILMLKQKFNEIKRNISLIEDKQARFFSRQTDESSFGHSKVGAD